MLLCLCLLWGILVSLFPFIQSVNANDDLRKIDLFTQKEPYSGQGIDQPSDAFSPQEEVTLYANVTYRDYGVPNKPVLFDINGPYNPIENVSLSGTRFTNESGIAKMSFRVPWPAENAETIVFGTWTAIANVDIAEEIVQDILTFKVGWIVEILSIETVGRDFQPETRFAKGGELGVKLHLKNIALTSRTVTIAINVRDKLNVIVNSKEIRDLEITPCDTYIYLYLQLPFFTATGNANVSADAYTAPPELEGVPYCPSVSSTFLVMPMCDVAVVDVVASPTMVCVGESVNIRVTVANKGDKTENFNVTVYYDENSIETQTVSNLSQGASLTLTFVWNTTGMQPSVTYTISAEASKVPYEIDWDNNRFIDDTVKIEPWPPKRIVPKSFMLPGIILLILAVFIIVILVLRKLEENLSQ